LERKKPLIFCGDFNVAHTELDLANPQANVRNHGFTPQERAGFGNFIKAGFIDTFREFESRGGHYTWWSPMPGVRQKNVGWRIDYVLISPALRPRLKTAFIRCDILGSDHCPVGIEID
jgi:exodeoxyribonuclease-3